MKDEPPRPRPSVHAENRSRQRVDRGGLPNEVLASLWACGRPAVKDDFERFCAVKQTDKAYRVAIKRGEAFLVVKSLVNDVIVTVIKPYERRTHGRDRRI